MKFITHNQKHDIDTNMTHLQGYITATYRDLINVFGEPIDGRGCPGEKTDVEWNIQFEDGTVATIYNWKNGFNYCGEFGTPVHSIISWNIGGHSIKALELVSHAACFESEAA